MMRNFLSLIIKVTRHCNLRCTYCNEWEAAGEDLSFATAAQLVSRALEQKGADTVNFIWHGGEPLLKGHAFYRKVVYLQDRLRGEKKVINSLQTNGLLVDDRWMELFEACNFNIGLSLDGPPELHNRQRMGAGGRDSHAKTMQALNMLKNSDVSHGVLTVVTPATLEYGPQRMFAFLMESGIQNMAFLQMRPESRPEARYDPRQDYVDDSRFVPYIKEMFDLWYELDDPSVTIRRLNSIVQAMVGGRASVCTLTGGCVGNNYGIDTTGDIYHCDRYVHDDDYHLGHIRDVGFDELREDEALQRISNRDNERRKGCRDCRWYSCCRGGCPHEAYIAERSGLDDGGCREKRQLFEHIYHRLNEDMAEVVAGLEQV